MSQIPKTPAAARLIRLAFFAIGIGCTGVAFGAIYGRYDAAFWQIGAVVFGVSVVVALSIAAAGLSVVLEQG